MDFACGKGGDLTKYKKANVGTYSGVDIALESVRRDAVERYNSGNYPFPARFIAGKGLVFRGECDGCDECTPRWRFESLFVSLEKQKPLKYTTSKRVEQPTVLLLFPTPRRDGSGRE